MLEPVNLSSVPCFLVGQAGNWRIDSSRMVRHSHEGTVADAYRLCEKLGLRKPGQCVIIRPNYNEADPVKGVLYFREWRSFDAGPFVEARWDCFDLLTMKAVP